MCLHRSNPSDADPEFGGLLPTEGVLGLTWHLKLLLSSHTEMIDGGVFSRKGQRNLLGEGPVCTGKLPLSF